MNKKGKRVERVDRDGNIVATYESVSEAARKCYISKTSVHNRCHGIANNPYDLDGYTYRFKEEEEEMRNDERSNV